MKVKVEKEACIGCGACQAICDTVFEIGDDGYATTKIEEINDEVKEEVLDAANGCPTEAIKVEE